MRGIRIKPKIEYKPPLDNIRVIYSTSVKYWNDISVWAIMGYMSDDEKDVKPWDLFNGSPRSPEEVAQYRLEICNGCEFFRKTTQTCKKCGCFMKAKSMLLNAKCPIGKW